MKTPESNASIDGSLKVLLRQIRKTQLLRAALIAATVILLGVLLIMAADYLFAPLHSAARWCLFAAWLVAVAMAFKKGFSPLFRKITMVQLARWIEDRHPEMQERISTSLELQDNSQGVSAGLLEELRIAAQEYASKVNARMEVLAVSTARHWGRPATALAIVLGVLLAVWPRESARLLVRAVAPFSHFGNAGAARFDIKPGSVEMLEGGALKIEIGYNGREPVVELVMKVEGEKVSSQTLSLSGERYLYELNPVTKTFRYHAKAGKAESDSFVVTVWPIPVLLDTELTVEYPQYTRLAPAVKPLTETLSAVTGSKVRLTAKTNTAIDSARIVIDGTTIATATVTPVAGACQLEFSWLLDKPGVSEASLLLKHRLGPERSAQVFSIETLEDKAPTVVILSPTKKDMHVRPDESIPVSYEATEDFGLARVAIELNDHGEKTISLGQNLPFLVKGSQPPRYRGESPLAIGDLISRLGGKKDFRIRVRAEDARPKDMAGPGVGFSEWLHLIVDDNAESLVRQELREQHEGAMQEIDKTIQEIREARQKMDARREEVKTAKPTPEGEKQLAEAAEKLAQAEEKIKELSEKMEEGIHAKLADETAKAAEKIEESRDNLEKAPLQDEQAQREQKIDEARTTAEEAVKQLEAVKQEMQKENQKIQDLAKLQDLAQKQQELARQAEEQQQKPDAAEKPPEQWQQQQEQVEQQLRQELAKQPKALAEALKAEAEQAKALAEEAKEIAKEQQQLQELAKQAAEQNNQLDEKAQDALKEALVREQEKIAKETAAQLDQAREQQNELANTLPEAAKATETAKEQIAEAKPQEAQQAAAKAQDALEAAAEQAAQAAAEPKGVESEPKGGEGEPKDGEAVAGEPKEGEGEPKGGAGEPQDPPSAAEKKELAEQAQALEQLAERQQDVAEALEALAAGDETKALQQLQEAQAQQAQEVAEAIAAIPRAMPSSPLQQAEQSSKQGSQQAQQASTQSQQSQQQQSSQKNQASQQSFEKSAQSLEQAASELSNAAQQAAQQNTPPQQAEASPQALAEAFEQASQASENPSAAEAAEQAGQAAEALQEAAQSAKAAMQGKPGKPGKPGPPSPPGPPGEPSPVAGTEPKEGPRTTEPDPGVPPELAKLGISAADWEKIQASLRSDVGTGAGAGIPEEYRELVKGYFQNMAEKNP
jgi:hypothetical protein